MGASKHSTSNSDAENLNFSFFPKTTRVPAKFELESELRKFELLVFSQVTCVPAKFEFEFEVRKFKLFLFSQNNMGSSKIRIQNN